MNPLKFISKFVLRSVVDEAAKCNDQIRTLSTNLALQFKRDKESLFEMRREVESINGLMNAAHRTIRGTNEMISALQLQLLSLQQGCDTLRSSIDSSSKELDEDAMRDKIDSTFNRVRLYAGDQSKVLQQELDVFGERAEALKTACAVVRKEWSADKKLQRCMREMEDLHKRLGMVIAAVDYRGKILATVVSIMQVSPESLQDIYHHLRVLDTHYKMSEPKDEIPF